MTDGRSFFSCYAYYLGKELPRIPAVKTYADFMAFSQAGRELAHWHLNFETVECYPGVTVAAMERSDIAGHFTSKPNPAISNRQAQQDGEAWRLETAATFRVTKIKSPSAKTQNRQARES